MIEFSVRRSGISKDRLNLCNQVVDLYFDYL